MYDYYTHYCPEAERAIRNYFAWRRFAFFGINPDFTIKKGPAEILEQGTRYYLIKSGENPEDVGKIAEARLVPEEEMKKMPNVIISHRGHHFNSILLRERDIGLGTDAGTWLSYENFFRYAWGKPKFCRNQIHSKDDPSVTLCHAEELATAECPFDMSEICNDNLGLYISHDFFGEKVRGHGQCADFRLLEEIELQLKDIQKDKKLETLAILLTGGA